MSKHTLGPWEVYEHPVATPHDAKLELSAQVDATEFQPVLYMISAGGPENPKAPAITGCGPTSKANAHLIAAAPDLLEACEEAVQFFIHFAKHDPELASRYGVDDEAAPIRAAIRKARGGK